MAFLILLLAEWGSHSVIEQAPLSSEAASLFVSESPHGDPCDSLILCSDSRRNDQQRSSLSREMTPHCAPLDMFAALQEQIWVSEQYPVDLSTAYRLFRPNNPPFYPPELS